MENNNAQDMYAWKDIKEHKPFPIVWLAVKTDELDGYTGYIHFDKELKKFGQLSGFFDPEQLVTLIENGALEKPDDEHSMAGCDLEHITHWRFATNDELDLIYKIIGQQIDRKSHA